MEIRELRAFVAVVEDGGLSAAARRLHVSQSAVSQTVQSLERQLGLALLVRSHAGVAPTDAGAKLLVHARSLVAGHDRALAEMTAASDERVAGVIRVGVPLELPADLLPNAVAELAAACPDSRVEVRHRRSAAQLAELRAGELDVALVRDRPADPDLDAVLVVEEALGVLLAAERAAELADAVGVQLHRLAALEWSGFPRGDSPAWHDQVTAILRGHGVPLQVERVDDDVPVIAEVKVAAVGSGRAFALAPPSWAHQLPQGISWHPLVGRPLVRRTWAVWPAAARQRDLAVFVSALDRLTSAPSDVSPL